MNAKYFEFVGFFFSLCVDIQREFRPVVNTTQTGWKMVDNARHINPWHACWISNISLSPLFFIACTIFFLLPIENCELQGNYISVWKCPLASGFSAHFFDNEMEELSHLTERFMNRLTIIVTRNRSALAVAAAWECNELMEEREKCVKSTTTTMHGTSVHSNRLEYGGIIQRTIMYDIFIGSGTMSSCHAPSAKCVHQMNGDNVRTMYQFLWAN